MSPILVDVDTGQVPDDTPPPVPPTTVAEHSYAYSLVGADDELWDLVAGPLYASAGMSGLGVATPEHRWRDSVTANGSAWHGLRFPMREFTLPLEVDGRGLEPAAWRDLDRRVWSSVGDPRRECRLIVTAPNGQRRSLVFRVSDGMDEPFELDPMLRQDVGYQIECQAGDPLWHGDTVRRTFSVASDLPFFPGPPFGIGDATAISATAVVANPGDEPSPPRWTITGPYTSVTVGVGDSVVTLGTGVGPGQTRIVEMGSPRSIRDQDGVLRWGEATELVFADVPPGAAVPLSMQINGGIADQTLIELEFDPLYRRAFS